MLKTLLLNLLLLVSCFVYGQETVKRTNQLCDEIIENFTVLKSDKKIRQGEYTATTKGIVVAKGTYKDGKRTGTWQFYNFIGTLTQTYNYDNNTINVIDTNETRSLKYYFAKDINETDTVNHPIKIGGAFFGLFAVLFNQRVLLFTIRRDYADFLNIKKFSCKHILTVSPKGELIKHEVVVSGNSVENLYILDDSKFEVELKRFVPGMINNHPVESKIVTTSNITFSNSR